MYHIKNQENIPIHAYCTIQLSSTIPENKALGREKKVKNRRGTTTEATFMAINLALSPVSSSIIKVA